MSKGLQQMISEALAQQEAQPAPVLVSGDAMRALAMKMRQWSGWPGARVTTGDPRKAGFGSKSPFASTDIVGKRFVFNTDVLVLNPNRVLSTVTPFRMRQEAVLTGAMLHEAGHARHSKWWPITKEQAEANPGLHSDGTVPTAQCKALAFLMEEPRVEGLMFRDADRLGAATLGWTMRASAAHICPMTEVSADPNQQIMDVIQSWTLRAGREIALAHWDQTHAVRGWVGDFTSLLHNTVLDHLTERESNSADCTPVTDTPKIIDGLRMMMVCEDDTGSTMIDLSRMVLDLLFPETPGEDNDEDAQPGAGCAMAQAGEDEAGDEGNSEPEDEGEEPGAGDKGDDPGEDEGKGKSDQPEDEGDQPEDDGATGSTEQQAEQSEQQSALTQVLAALEAQAGAESMEDAEEDADEAEEQAGKGAGASGPGQFGGGYRKPTAEERDMQKGAEHFLRDMLDTSESSKIALSDSPSATVDAGQLAAWKAGGQHADPRFFRRTQRTSEPSPPVKIAVLVDVSSSMDELQKPSSVLSWELAAAALDLRNFAGRGQQVESCLIHWGTSERVIQRPGEMLPGIKEHLCDDGTQARSMARAIEMADELMPGFLDISDQPCNRLLVQFTDWQLFSWMDAQPAIERVMEAGVNMLSVVPDDYSPRYGSLDDLVRLCKVQRGKSSLLRYNRNQPERVWQQAAEVLA